MEIHLEGRVADPRRGPARAACSIERAFALIGTRSAVLLLREAAYGTGRFDEFVQRTGLTEAVVSSRLRELVDTGLLATEPYQEPGQRTRNAYVLTDAGRDLVPVLIALGAWAQTYLPRRGVTLTHHGCGARIRADLTSRPDAQRRPARPARTRAVR
jgi:DNA-binding HxlR family transcriptional regulator